MAGLRIGVLTFHRCINYGSYWQARCLVDGLRQLGHESTILDHDSTKVNIAEWKCALEPLLPSKVLVSDKVFYRQKIKAFFDAFETMPLSPRFNLEQPHDMQDYDVVVVGSDEVWNLTHPWYGRYSIFYGDGVKAKYLISYAASFGNYSASWGLEPTWADKLQQFSSISVRDENSRQLVKNAINVNTDIVLDPCLQFELQPDERDNDILNRKYIGVYGHNFTDDFIQKIKRYAQQKTLPLISIGYRNDWADEQWISADPHDFAHFISRSQAMATNFFHGCVFSLRNQKPFVTETSYYRSTKVQGLVSELGAEKHLLTSDMPDETLYACLEQPIETTVLQKINSLRQSSNRYLVNALNVKPR